MTTTVSNAHGAPAGRQPALFVITGLVVGITLAHYLTSPHEPMFHAVFRRLYYLPIVWAAFLGGIRGGLLVAGLITAAYIPHAFLLEHHHDPGPSVDKASEIAIYWGVGFLAGWLVDRERRARRQAERENLERLAAEKDAARLEGLVHLTRGLAHEIRNPLGSIQGAIEIIAGGLPADAREREMADIGLRETARLERVLRDFRDFARPRPPTLSRLRPAESVDYVVGLLHGEAAAAGLELRGEAGTTRAAVGDEDQLTQVLVNLVRNAIAATPEGGRIDLRAVDGERDGEAIVRFEVVDTGEGIPEELGASIYDPYVTGREDGTGLGLPIAATLVRQQGGLLSHRARPEGGTVFHFWLPAEASP